MFHNVRIFPFYMGDKLIVFTLPSAAALAVETDDTPVVFRNVVPASKAP